VYLSKLVIAELGTVWPWEFLSPAVQVFVFVAPMIEKQGVRLSVLLSQALQSLAPRLRPVPSQRALGWLELA